jgi:hypothetical protein
LRVEADGRTDDERFLRRDASPVEGVAQLSEQSSTTSAFFAKSEKSLTR